MIECLKSHSSEQNLKKDKSVSDSSTIEAPGSKAPFSRITTMCKHYDKEVRLDEFKDIPSNTEVSIPNYSENGEFIWDKEVEREYRKNMKKLYISKFKNLNLNKYK